MNEDRFEQLLRETAEEYNRPPDTPTERMWMEIQRQRGAEEQQPTASPAWWRRPTLLVPLAAAAVLILGIGIGRWSAPFEPGPEIDSAVGIPVADGSVDSVKAPTEGAFFRAAAGRHLQQTETLLTLFAMDSPVDDDSARQERIHLWARQLLGDTRLLMDSPAAEDAALGQLLSDLEFFLARIVHVSGERINQDKARINDDLRNRGVMMRLRSQLPAGHV